MQDNCHVSEDQAIVEMSLSRGWEILLAHLVGSISTLTTELVETKFTSLAEVAALQAEIRGISKAIHFVETRVKRTRGQR